MKLKYSDIDLFLEPGDLHVSAKPILIKTILGSCVSVCLYDPQVRVGGINHYVLPCPGKNEPANGRYGTSSIEILFRKMKSSGAALSRMNAQVFGGARPLGGERGPQVGAANREMALRMLKTYHIPILQEHTGGELGRRVFFNTGTGRAVVSIIERNASLWQPGNRRTRS